LAEHPFYEPTQSLLNLIRGRAQVDEVIPLADNLRTNISENISLSPDTTPDSAVRTITMQILLHVGSRSISHFLNAIERYLPLLRTLGSTADNKLDYLNASARFWRRNPQMINIVFDKLMQYQIVDPSDTIGWSFKSHEGDTSPPHINVQGWGLLKAGLDKAIGRVSIARQKVQTLRKEEEDAKAKVMAISTAEDMEVDGESAKKGMI
jgi:nuclear cap-binding protein subunit 1